MDDRNKYIQRPAKAAVVNIVIKVAPLRKSLYSDQKVAPLLDRYSKSSGAAIKR